MRKNTNFIKISPNGEISYNKKALKPGCMIFAGFNRNNENVFEKFREISHDDLGEFYIRISYELFTMKSLGFSMTGYMLDSIKFLDFKDRAGNIEARMALCGFDFDLDRLKKIYDKNNIYKLNKHGMSIFIGELINSGVQGWKGLKENGKA